MLNESQYQFFKHIASGDELEVANRLRDLGLSEYQQIVLKGDTSTFLCLFFLGHWLERSTKVILTLYRRDVQGSNRNLSKMNRDQSHTFLNALKDILKIWDDHGLAPVIANRHKRVLEARAVQDFLGLLENAATARVGRYHNLETMVDSHENVGFTSAFHEVLHPFIIEKTKGKQFASQDLQIEYAEKQRDLFVGRLASVLTNLLHFPVNQGAIGESAKMELAGRTDPIPPDVEIFEYLW